MVAQSLMAQGFANTMQMYGASAAEDQIGRGHGPGHAQRLPPGRAGATATTGPLAMRDQPRRVRSPRGRATC